MEVGMRIKQNKENKARESVMITGHEIKFDDWMERKERRKKVQKETNKGVVEMELDVSFQSCTGEKKP